MAAAAAPGGVALPDASGLPCALVTIRADGRMLAANPAAGALLGRDAATLPGQAFDAMLTVAAAVIFQSYLLPLLRLHGHLQEFSITTRGADGSPLEVLLYAGSRALPAVAGDEPAPADDCAFGEGASAAAGLRVHDLVLVPIRQRRRVEEEMLRVKRAADEAPGMIFQLICLPDGRSHFPYVSEAVRSLYATTPQAAHQSAEAVFCRVLPDDRPLLDSSRQSAAAVASPWRASARVQRPDGSLGWHEFSATPRQLAGGVVLWHGHAEDVTQRRAAEQALADREAARQASQAKSEFLARVSHELRTPLNGILGFAHLLATRDADNLRDDQRRRLAVVHTAGQALLHLINDVLDITSIEMGQLSLRPEPLRLQPALEAALAVVEPQAQALELQLRCEVDAELAVLADPRRLQQVLVNLLSNAVKYNRRGGWVLVQARALPDAGPGELRVAIGVRDSGLGMSVQQQQQLFQPFNRLGAEQGSAEGTGLGLVITRQLVQLMHGTITVRSAPGSGSQFEVQLPRASLPGTAASASAAQAAAPGSGPPRRVLYVEDNQVNVLLMQAVLGLRPGLQLAVAGDAASALRQAAEQPPELLLLDMQLPDGDGIALLAALRLLPGLAAVPAVAVSAAARADDLQRAQAAGFVGYWTKPLVVDEVLAGLDQLLPAAPA